MGITVGEIFQSIMAGVSLLSNATFTLVVTLACFNKVTWFYDLVNIPYNKDPSRRSLLDSGIRLLTLFLGIICEALAGRFTKYGIFGSVFSFVETLTFLAIIGQVFILIKEMREMEKRRKAMQEKLEKDIEESKQRIRENLNQHAVAIQVDLNPEEFFELMSDPEEFKKWLKDHKLQLTEEDRMQMSPEEEEMLVEMGFLPSREEVAEAREKAALEASKEPKKKEPEKDEDLEKDYRKN